jgi:hypothetical protein
VDHSLALRELQALSFSRYARLRQCLLGGAILGRAGRAGSASGPRQRSQVVGDILHEVMAALNQRAGGGVSSRDFRELFTGVTLVAAARLRGNASSRHLGDPANWPEIADLYRRLARVVETARTRGPSVETFAERTLSSNDGLLQGRLDAFFVSESGVDIVDYKSGLFSDRGAPQQLYVEQLLFYAYLVEETYGRYPRSLTLIGRDGAEVCITPDSERTRRIVADVRATMATYNARISSSAPEDMATPSSEGCLFCERKALCGKFWEALPSLEVPSWNHVAIGSQATPMRKAGRGGGWIELKVERSSLPARLLKITRLFEARFPGVDLQNGTGQRLVLTGLRHASGRDIAVAEATDRTSIASMESAR